MLSMVPGRPLGFMQGAPGRVRHPHADEDIKEGDAGDDGSPTKPSRRFIGWHEDP